MKNIRLITLLVAALSITFVGCNKDKKHRKHKKQQKQTLSLQGNGSINVAPNQANFTVSISCVDKDISQAKSCLIDQSNEVMDLLKQLGIKDRNLKTTNVRLNKQNDWVNRAYVFRGYSASTSIRVTIDDMSKASEIYTSLLDNENISLNGLSYSHSAMDSLRNEAYAKALQNTHALADRLLEELPQEKKKVRRIGNVAFSSPSFETVNMKMNLLEADNAMSQKSIATTEGEIIVNAQLFVDYIIR